MFQCAYLSDGTKVDLTTAGVTAYSQSSQVSLDCTTVLNNEQGSQNMHSHHMEVRPYNCTVLNNKQGSLQYTHNPYK